MKNIKMEGLSDEEVLKSRENGGDNLITEVEKTSLWKLYFEKFDDPMIKILLFAVALSLIIAFIHNDFTEVIGVTIAVILATSIGFWFEYDASRKFNQLNALGDEILVKVRRNGEVIEISKKDVVVGDIVLLESGEEVPADGELLVSVSLLINESTLTGEPSISKTTDVKEFKKDATYPSNHLLRGTTVIEGNCEMVVLTVGDNTEFGKVTRLSTTQTEEKTPLTIQLDKLAQLISVVGAAFSFTLFVTLYLKDILFSSVKYPMGQIIMLIGLLVSMILMFSRLWLKIIADANAMARKESEPKVYLKFLGWWFWIILGIVTFVVFAYFANLFGVSVFNLGSWINLDIAQDILSNFMVAVTLIVVAVPEGLPMSVTLSLALNMRRMLQTNNLVRKMHASETMGAITVICTDKTGTLTKNQMSVSKADFFISKSNGGSDDREGMIVQEAISVNTTAHLDRKQTPIKAIGNPTEASLLLWLEDNKIDYMSRRLQVKVVDQLTFSTKHKYMATMVISNLWNGQKVVYIKGAPEVILQKSNHISLEGNVEDISKYRAEIEDKLLTHQNRAQRTLAFAYKIVDGDGIKCKDVADAGDFVFMGIVAISDPVRPDVKDAIGSVHGATIDVKIVTGDTPATAVEIARQIGVWDDSIHGDFNRITGIEFEALSDEVLLDRVLELKIISRARPADKQRLVELLQKKGAIVAVTGDGTNDAPALNYAHVGLSMGSGTSVAKEASDITLIDDSFKSIATAVMWGRSLYKNIQRFLFFQLTINVIALMIVLIGAFTGEDVPLTITQMLWVNLIMDTFAAAALASLPPSQKVMNDKPRGKNDFIITDIMRNGILQMALFQIVVLSGLLYYIEVFSGFEFVYGMTIFFTTFVMLQFWNIFNAKSFSSGNQSAFKGLRLNSAFIVVVFIILVGQILIVSFGGEMFRVVPLSIYHWSVIIGSTSLILWSGEFMRLVNRIKSRRDDA